MRHNQMWISIAFLLASLLMCDCFNLHGFKNTKFQLSHQSKLVNINVLRGTSSRLPSQNNENSYRKGGISSKPNPYITFKGNRRPESVLAAYRRSANYGHQLLNDERGIIERFMQMGTGALLVLMVADFTRDILLWPLRYLANVLGIRKNADNVRKQSPILVQAGVAPKTNGVSSLQSVPMQSPPEIKNDVNTSEISKTIDKLLDSKALIAEASAAAPEQYECEKCGTSLFPAKGRIQLIFGNTKFRCPTCGSTPTAFFDISDMNDPRAVERKNRIAAEELQRQQEEEGEELEVAPEQSIAPSPVPIN